MTRLQALAVSLCGAFSIVALSPVARADVWNKKTIVEISSPVEVPGAVLQPGKYVFKLVDSAANRHIVRIANEAEDHVYTTVLAIPNYRLQPANKTVLTFYEMPQGQPEALRAWFYPGDNFGQEFAYPDRRAAEISQMTSLKVPVAPEETVAAAPPPPAPEPAPTPQPVQESPMTSESSASSSTEVAKVEAPASEPAQSQPAEQPAMPASETASSHEMPKTASNTPLVALAGILSLAAAFGLRRAAKRMS